MAILPILQFPDPRLRIKAQAVSVVDETLRKQVEDMYETMYDSRGVGLAATQVNIHKRFFVMDVSDNKSEQICVINPEIVHQEGLQYEVEGCLSVNAQGDKVKRAAKVRLKGTDLAGQALEFEAEGLMAVCIQHEIDHLNGVLFIDHLSRLKQTRIKEKIEKAKR